MKMEITLQQIVDAGSIESAILAACDDRGILTATPAGGPTFATSGPGPGMSKQYGADDYVLRAVRNWIGGTDVGDDGEDLEVVDPEDGRVASVHLPAGCACCDVEDDASWDWSEGSVVSLICPTVEQAIEHGQIVWDMIESGHELEQRSEWAKLVLADVEMSVGG